MVPSGSHRIRFPLKAINLPQARGAGHYGTAKTFDEL
jgi:hypothetical protein